MNNWWEDENLVKMVYEEAEKGNDAVQCELAARLMEHGNTMEALQWYKRSAAAGNLNAMFNLGILYTEGRNNLPAVPEQAFFWFDQAAAKGDAEAMYMTARFLLDGFGCEKNEEQAANLLEAAMKLGFSQAAELLYQLPGRQQDREEKMAVMEEYAMKAEQYLAAGNLEAAVPELQSALEKSTELFGEADAYTAAFCANLAHVYAALGNFDRSIPLRERILEQKEKTVSKNHPEYLIAALNLASDYNKTGRFQSALSLSGEAYNAAAASYPVLHELRLLAGNRYAQDLIAAGKFLRAKEILTAMLEQAGQQEKPENFEKTTAGKRLAKAAGLSRQIADIQDANQDYFSLEESRQNYAWVCAELMELLEAFPEDYLDKIDEAELSHYREQAALAACYVSHAEFSEFEPEPYAETLQALLSLKYIMPPAAVCAEECDLARVKATVTWVQNELTLILTVFPKVSRIDRMNNPQPVDFLKSLNVLETGKSENKAAKAEDVELIAKMADPETVKISFSVVCDGEKRSIEVTYHDADARLDAPEGFKVCDN